MKKLLIFIIELYQNMPLLSHSMCRFTPTCSEYTKQAIKRYGTIKGLKLGIKRIIRCHPFGKYGYDPLKEDIYEKNI